MYEGINGINFAFLIQLLLLKNHQNQVEENESNYLTKYKILS